MERCSRQRDVQDREMFEIERFLDNIFSSKHPAHPSVSDL